LFMSDQPSKDKTLKTNLIEPKWQKKWEEEKLYSPDMLHSAKSFYNLWMFPYPSAEGLHAGHAFASTGSDIYGRFMRMHGYDVFQPIGYDSFGIHSENYAIKIKEHPQNMLDRTTKHYKKQLESLGHGYDWTRTVTTSDPDYYKWTQWLFIQLFKAGLAYRKKAPVNWCPSCKTVLSDEQVINGACERCNTTVEKRDLEQWFFRITDYAERLLSNLKKINWPEKIKAAQTNWIGKSEGAKVKFQVKDSELQIEVFTTRPDTLYGATFLVLSPDSPWVQKVTTKDKEKSVTDYIKEYQKKVRSPGEKETEKTGVFTGSYVVNPVNDKEIPIWVADYVLSGYGTGAISAVPAHDQRDWEFAQKFDLKIIEVISGGKNLDKESYEGEGEIVNSDNWNGLKYPQDLEKILSDLKKRNCGQKVSSYHLRDWLISRQRYWGPPIPMIYCEKCDWQPVPEEDLPVLLPTISDYEPEGTGKGPLAKHPEFYETTCPKCGGKARRETDVSDTFLDSAWYYLRYPSVGAKTAETLPFDPEITPKWLPVNLYFGGAEHAVLHLMYVRFINMVLYDLKKIEFEEPFPRFYAHGLMIKDGAKMSKSRGNVVNPDEYIAKFGADTLRLYLMFMGPMDGSPDFRDTGIEGMRRFIDRVWKVLTAKDNLEEKDKKEVYIKLNQTIKKVTEDIEEFKYNTAISAVMEFINLLSEKGADEKVKKGLTLILAPFAPHLTEEVWVEILGQPFSVHNQPWPEYDSELIQTEKITFIVQVNGKLRGQMEVDPLQAKSKEEMENLSKKDQKVSNWIGKGEIKQVIFVPGKLINFVV
jgi:leucyl-tRNA synthetase